MRKLTQEEQKRFHQHNVYIDGLDQNSNYTIGGDDETSQSI
jgi:hypothetical protein